MINWSTVLIPPGWGSSEPIYNVKYHADNESTIDPKSLPNKYVYLSEACENCRTYGLTAILWDAAWMTQKGTINKNGTYQLKKGEQR